MEEYKKKVIKRKTMHMLIGIVLFLLYYFIEIDYYVSFLFILSMGIIIGESFGLYEKIYWIKYVLDTLSKKEERFGEGFLFMLSSFMIGSLLLSKEMFFFLFWLITISDAFSSIVGTYYGKRINRHLKSWAGFAAYVLSSLPLILFSSLDPLISIFTIISSAFIELLEVIEDNVGIAVYLSLIGRLL